jgi:hypothetical protein
MHSLRVNCIVSPGDGSELLEKSVRVLGIKDDFVIVIELGKNPTKPWRLEKSFLIEEIDSGAAVISQETVPVHLLRSDDELSENEKNSRDKNWNLVRDLVENQDVIDILTSNFGALVANHAMEMGVDRKQIYRLLYRYWSMGQSRNAFLWNTSTCGGRGKEKNRSSGIIPGRPAKYLGVVVSDDGVIARAGLTQLPKFHWPRLLPSEPLPVLDFCRLVLGHCGIGHWVNSASAPTILTQTAEII